MPWRYRGFYVMDIAGILHGLGRSRPRSTLSEEFSRSEVTWRDGETPQIGAGRVYEGALEIRKASMARTAKWQVIKRPPFPLSVFPELTGL